MALVMLYGEYRTEYTNYSGVAVQIYDATYYYSEDIQNRIIHEYDVVEYPDVDSIVIVGRRKVFEGRYYNEQTRQIQNTPYRKAQQFDGRGNPKYLENPPALAGVENIGYVETPVIVPTNDGSGNDTPSLFPRLNVSTIEQLDPDKNPYQGKTVADRIKWLKSVIAFCKSDIKTKATSLDRKVRQYKARNKDNQNDKIIVAAASLVGSIFTGSSIFTKFATGLSSFIGFDSVTTKLKSEIETETIVLQNLLIKCQKYEDELKALQAQYGDDGTNTFWSKYRTYILVGIGLLIVGVVAWWYFKRK